MNTIPHDSDMALDVAELESLDSPSFRELNSLYFDGTHETERGCFAVICSHRVDGNIMDVYAESETAARNLALEIISRLNPA